MQRLVGITITEASGPSRSGLRLVRKKLCHARLGTDVAEPCSHACLYCYTKQLDYLRELGVPVGVEKITLYTGLPRLLDKFFTENPIRYPIRYGVFSNTCMPYRRTTRILDGCLKVHLKHEWPTMIFTKVPLHKHIPDTLLELADRGLLCVAVTITSFDPAIADVFEPRAPKPEERAEFIQWLHDHGVCWALRVTPLYQGLTDTPEAFRDILSRLPRGHVVVEYLRLNKREHAEFFRSYGVEPWEYVRPFYIIPPDLASERILRLRDEAHGMGWSFAICGHYIRFKIQDHRDCCTGPADFYGKFMPYDPAKARDPRLRSFIRNELPRTPLMLWRSPSQNLAEEVV